MQTLFDLLQLPQQFSVDESEIEKQYLLRSREVHPDFHQLGTSADQEQSLEHSSALNEAYTVLKDPFQRADYLLKLHNGPTANEVKELPAAFLMEQLELREQIETILPEGSESPAFQEMEKNLQDRRKQLVQQLGKLFGQWETLPAESQQRAEILKQIRQQLNISRFLQGLLRDLH